MSTRRTMIIGQAPSRDGGLPLWGRAGKRLAALAGLTFDEYLLATERRNLLGTWPGKNGKGDAFPMMMARRRASAMIPWLAGKRVLFLGKLVAEAFGHEAGYFQWQEIDLFDAAVIPHPSGINRWWNDPENVERASIFLRAVLM